jgi:hypothetical protein
MAIIKARTSKTQFVRHITRLYRENNETLFAYAAFIGERPEYVLNQLVETILAKDKEFLTWREEHPDSYVPKPGTQAKPVSTGAKGQNAVISSRPPAASIDS